MAIAESNETIRREESRPSDAEALLAPIRAEGGGSFFARLLVR